MSVFLFFINFQELRVKFTVSFLCGHRQNVTIETKFVQQWMLFCFSLRYLEFWNSQKC